MNIIVAMLFQSIGKAKQASLTALSRQGLFFVPVILTLPKLIGLRGMQLSQPIADVATFAFSLFLVLRFWHTLNKRMGVSSADVKSQTSP
jgi:Na+-driven multidrug efflux pump